MKTTTRTLRFKPSAESGQSMVEFVVVLPIVIFVLFMFVQFVVAFHNYLAITDAARVGARKAAVSRTAANTCQEARNSIQATVSTTQWNTIQTRISCTPTTPGAVGTSYTVSISYPVTIGFPGTALLGFPLPVNHSFTMTTSATERLE
jgi:Flp pilus assembly protein TadG